MTRAGWLVAGILLLAAAAPSGNVYRERETYAPVDAASTVTLVRGKGTRDGRIVPSVAVSVTDESGKPVPGVGIGVTTFRGKRVKTDYVQAATDAAGRVSVRSDGRRKATSMTIALQADGGSKTIRANLDAGRDGWRLADVPYMRILGGGDEGDCRNLVRFSRTDGGAYALAFTVPSSLFECREVVYGSKRKEEELSRIDAIGHRDVNAGDKNFYSKDDETKMGLQASRQFDARYARVDDPEIVGYVTDLAKRVVAASDAPDMPVHVRVVNTDAVNAFVTAGGYVYVFTGLIKAADDEAELAGVLAHETSHAIARHVTEGATRNAKAQTGAAIGGLILGEILGTDRDQTGAIVQGSMTAAGIVTLRYDRKSEEEADLLGTQYLWNGGWDPEAMARFFRKMQSMGGASPPAWLSTHPSDAQRVRDGIQWARAFLPPKDRYLVDTPEFERVKAKVMALPPPPEPKAAPAQ